MNTYNSSLNENYKNKEDELNLKSLLNTFTRNRVLILSITSFFFLFSSIYAFSKKKIWEGQTEIVLKSDSLDNSTSLANNLRNLRIPGISIKSPANSIDTSIGILKSPSVLMPIFEFVNEKKIEIDEDYDENFFDWRDENLEFTLQPNTTILEVIYRDNEKNLIIPVLNKLTNAYQLYSGKNKKRGIQLTQNYLDGQIKFYKDKSLKSVQKAQEFAIQKNLSPLMLTNSSQRNLTLNSDNDTPFSSNLILGNNTDIEVMRLNAANEIKEIDIQIEEIKKLENYKDLQYLGSTIPSLRKSGLPKKLEALEGELVRLSKLYSNNSDEIINLKDERSLLINILKDRSIGYLKANRITVQSRLQSLTRPKQVLIEYKKLIRDASRDEKALIELENQLVVSKLEEAQLQDPWELISKPTLKDYPVAPNKKYIAFIGTILGFLLSYLICFFKEQSSGLIFENDDLERLLETKILETINSQNNMLETFSREIFINEILNVKVNKLKFINFGIDDKYEAQKYLKIIFKDQSKYEMVENLNQINKDDKLVLLTKLGGVYFKEINSFKKRLMISNQKLFGIILVQ